MEIKAYYNLPKEAFNIRKLVFVEEQGFKDEFDEIDAYAIHFVMYNLKKEAIATCRIYQKEKINTYIIGRFALLKEYRNQHLGSYFLNKIEEYLKSKDIHHVILHAQLQASMFYQKCGFVEFLEVDFDEATPIFGCKNIYKKRYNNVK